MIQLNTFRQMSSNEYDNNILQEAILEINKNIKENAGVFRILVEFSGDSIESKLYKNALTSYYLKKGFKIVTYDEYIYIEWSRVNVNEVSRNSNVNDINYIGDYFSAQDLYFCLTNNEDLRKISYRVLEHYVNTEIKKMKVTGVNESKISFGVSTTMASNYLNNMFAPELKKLNEKYTDVHFTFLDGCILRVRLYDIPEEYTDISLNIIYGTRPYQ